MQEVLEGLAHGLIHAHHLQAQPQVASYVRLWGQPGREMLMLSSSQFGPKPTSQRSPAHVSNFKISFSQGQSDQAFQRQGTMIGRHPAMLPDVPWFGANVGIKKTSLALERRHDGLSLVLYPNDQNLRYGAALIAHRMSDIGADVLHFARLQGRLHPVLLFEYEGAFKTIN